MKYITAILILGFILSGCQKEKFDARDTYAGNWNFEVTYTSIIENNVRESVFNCQGILQKGKDNESLTLHYCINDYLTIKINDEGVVYSLTNKLMGVIDKETCLIVDDNPAEKSISKITIKGVK